jgi:2'-5' RNA ligase
MNPGDRLICAFVEPQAVGAQFKDWFLHITIVPWFRLDMPSSRLAEVLKEGYVGSRPFEVEVGNETHFGYKNRKLVNLVSAPELMKLEGQTRRLLHAHKAWVVDEADKTRRRPYLPHVTALVAGRVQEGAHFRVDKLFIIEQKGPCKEVVGEMPL